MAQLFRPRANAIIRLVFAGVPCAVLLVFAYAYIFQGSPYATGAGMTPSQPVPFSHKHHVGALGLDCRYCHTGVENAAFAGMPPTSTCMTCHSQLWANAEMLAPVRNSLAENVPLRWNRVYRLPDYVFFNHGVHVKNGVGCSTCHGDMTKQPLTQQNAPLTMGWCLDCHRDPGPHLRPEGEIFDPETPDPHNPPDGSARMLRHYVINTANMTDCSTCHR